MCAQQGSASLMKLHVKADSVTPASLTRLCLSNGLTDDMAPRFRLASPTLGEALPPADQFTGKDRASLKHPPRFSNIAERRADHSRASRRRADAEKFQFSIKAKSNPTRNGQLNLRLLG